MKVRLSDYDENWIQLFEDETYFLKDVFGNEIIEFEHFGSTSVPGMKAKPVIDMMCLVKDIKRIDRFNEQMSSFGYDVAGEWGIQDRRLFRKGGEGRTHHIHFYQYDNPQIQRHLIFRDYLRTHPNEVELYTNLKERLAQKYDDTRFYSKEKRTFVNELEQRSMSWFKNQKQ